MIEFFVPGIARTSGSHNTYRGRVVHAGKYTKAWMDTVGWMFKQRFGRPCLADGPFSLKCMFYINRPGGHYGSGRNKEKLKPSAPVYHLQEPDLDKLVRAVQDSLTKLLWQDDKQVVTIGAVKVWIHKWQEPGVKICAEQLAEIRHHAMVPVDANSLFEQARRHDGDKKEENSVGTGSNSRRTNGPA